uniref:RHS repeat-associated core domain-containing protein n=1 Tax=Candidatus Cryptobacteroides bacterium TaxID=3085639 RepID=UPI004029871E
MICKPRKPLQVCGISLTDPTSKTVSSFYYDYQGRLIQSHRKEALGGAGHIHQSLTFTGKPSMTRETVALPDGRIDSLVTVRSYDGQERLVSETTSLNGRSQSVSYGYDEIGRMTGWIYGTEANPSTLTETLSYNIRDQLTGLNSSVFSMTLRYQEPTLGSVPKYNGGISEWEWNHGAGAETNAWSLSYDGVGRLTDARRFVSGVQTNSFSERSITYDRNSNALTLTRYGGNAATPEERLAYSYDGNLLSGISNTGASGGGGQYTHDANGNMTHEGLSGLDIVYNEQNLTRRISSGGTTLAEYEYLADGTKLRALDGGGNGYQYRGSLIYTQTAGQTGSPAITLDCAVTSAGRIVRENTADGSSTYKVQHYLRDHLGSVRAVIDGDTGTVIEASDYYPFGKRIQVTDPVSEPVGGSQHASEPAVAPVAPATSVASTSSPNRWLFSGKESQSFLYANIPLLDFGARMYNPTIARWTTSDPMSEKYYGISPYVYCLGNPISIIDPNGMDIWTMDEKGNVVWVKESDDHRLYYMNNDGLLSDDYVSVSDRSILDDLTKTEAKVDGGAKVSSHTSKSGINDIFKVFKFASDKTKVEWAVHRNGDTYTIGTGHNSYSASSWEDYTKDKPNATVHSHPGIDIGNEISSMGYGTNYYNTDQRNVIDDVEQNGRITRKSYVYFPNSSRLYYVGYYNASFIRPIRSYKSFYFGTLNNK